MNVRLDFDEIFHSTMFARVGQFKLNSRTGIHEFDGTNPPVRPYLLHFNGVKEKAVFPQAAREVIHWRVQQSSYATIDALLVGSHVLVDGSKVNFSDLCNVTELLDHRHNRHQRKVA